MKNKYAFFISVLTFLICQVNAQQLLLNEGFESGILSLGASGSGNTPEVVTSQDARCGNYVLKSQLSHSSTNPERTEATTGLPKYNFAIDQEYWVGISTKLLEDFNQGDFKDDGMIMQWHYRDWLYPDDTFKPQPFLLRYREREGKKKIALQHEYVDKSNRNRNRTKTLVEVPAYIGVWDDWVINIRFSETNGKFKVWRNGEVVLDWSGNNHLTERPDGAYLKFGLYSSQYDDLSDTDLTRIPDDFSRTVYHDEMRMAGADGSYDLVSPSSTGLSTSSEIQNRSKTQLWLDATNNQLRFKGVSPKLIEVYSINGAKVNTYKTPTSPINFNNVSKGVYIVMIHSNNGYDTIKIVQ